MGKITTVGLDLAKNVFQVHGVSDDGRVLVRRQLRRRQVLAFFEKLPPCLVGLEACAGAHYRARELRTLGHEVRLMPPSYVKPYVKRGKTDAADAAAICEAVTRPSMRFVPVKTSDQQAVLLQHRARDFLVRQLTQIANAIRAHLGEFGIVAPKGMHNVERLLGSAAEDGLPANAEAPINLLAAQFRETRAKVEEVTALIKAAPPKGCNRGQAGDGAGRRCPDFQRHRRDNTGGGELPQCPRFRGLARADAEAAFQRRQGTAGTHIENGEPVYPASPLSRCHGADQRAAEARSWR